MTALSEVGRGLLTVGRGLLTPLRYSAGILLKPGSVTNVDWNLSRRDVPDSQVNETLLNSQLWNSIRLIVAIAFDTQESLAPDLPDSFRLVPIGLTAYYSADMAVAILRRIGRSKPPK